MKKDTAIKKLTTYHADVFAAIHKIRDLVYSLDDDELTEVIDQWVENFESFLDDEGGIEDITEIVDEVLSIAE